MNLIQVFDAKRCMSGMLRIVEALTLGHFHSQPTGGSIVRPQQFAEM